MGGKKDGKKTVGKKILGRCRREEGTSGRRKGDAKREGEEKVGKQEGEKVLRKEGEKIF